MPKILTKFEQGHPCWGIWLKWQLPTNNWL